MIGDFFEDISLIPVLSVSVSKADKKIIPPANTISNIKSIPIVLFLNFIITVGLGDPLILSNFKS